jgi:hypothetical protein
VRSAECGVRTGHWALDEGSEARELLSGMSGTLIRRRLSAKDTMHRAMDAVGGLYVAGEPADPQDLRIEVLARGIRALEIPPGVDAEWVRGLPLEFLVVHSSDSVEFIGTLQRLRGLRLASWTGQLRFDGLPALEWFDTAEPERGQLEPLLKGDNEHLHHLGVGRYPFTDTTPLANLKHLTHAALGDSRRLVSVTGLDRLRQLRHLVLYVCPRLESLAGVEEAPGLTHIEIENCNRITDLSPLARLVHLRSVKIEARKPPSLASLIGHPGLEYIWIVSTKRPAPGLIEPLLESPRLRFLAAGRSCWLRRDGGWEHVPNIYAATPDQGVLHETLVDEYHRAAAW